MTTEKQKHTPQTMDELDESLRVKYRGILDGLTITELKRFPLSKSKYKHLIMSEIYEHFPEAESKVVDNTAQFISNFLNNEAPKVKAKKLQSSSKTQTKRQTRSSTDIDRYVAPFNDRFGTKLFIDGCPAITCCRYPVRSAGTSRLVSCHYRSFVTSGY